MRRSERKGLLWTFVEKEKHSPWQKTYRFDFSCFRSVRLRAELQEYVWCHYRSRDKMLATLRQEYSWMKYYEAWLYERGIDSLAGICQADVDGFLTYLHTCLSNKTKKPLRLITQKHIYDTVRAIYRWYAAREKSFADAYQMFPTDVYQRMNRIPRTDCATQGDITYFLQRTAQVDNPCLRYGGTILTVTGLSPSDLLSLQTDCIRISKKGAHLRYYHHRKHRFLTIPVNENCVRAVEQLKEQTANLRSIAPEEEQRRLFLHCDKWENVITPDADLFRYWMRRAQREGGGSSVADEAHRSDGGSQTAGDKMLTCTMIRYALLRDMWERNVPYMVIRELTGYPLFAERGSIA